jgi:hypothetical protein
LAELDEDRAKFFERESSPNTWSMKEANAKHSK